VVTDRDASRGIGTNISTSEHPANVETGRDLQQELKLPDHVIVKVGSGITVAERRTGQKHNFALPVNPVLRTHKSPVRILAGVASTILVLYLASILAPALLSRGWQGVLLLVLIVVPFIAERVSNGKVAALAYLVSFMIFGSYLGILGSGMRLGVIFFGGGPGSATSYAVVPASSLLPVLLLGLLPYVVVAMLGQVLVRFDVVFPSTSGEYRLVVRHQGMASEIIAFVGPDSRGTA